MYFANYVPRYGSHIYVVDMFQDILHVYVVDMFPGKNVPVHPKRTDKVEVMM